MPVSINRYILRWPIMKRFLVLLLLFSLLIIPFDSKVLKFYKYDSDSMHRTMEMQLYEKLSETESGSIEYNEVNNLLRRLNYKQQLSKPRSENPGDILEAFREIKTSFDGKIYSTDYQNKELKKALERKQSLYKKPDSKNLPWIERGPGNVSGRARTLIVDPDDPLKNTWFVGTVGGGIWKTENAGQTWENKTPDFSTLSTMTMAMAESNHDVIYVGTGMGYGRVIDLAGSGVWKSTDRGESWTQLSSTKDGQLLPAINRLVIDPNDEDIVVLCSNGDYTSFGPNGGSRESAIFKTTDGGQTWKKVFDSDSFFGNRTDNRVQQIISNPKNFNTLYAAVNEVGVIKSTDAGESWTISADNFARPQDIGTGEGTYQGISTRTEIAISPSDTSRLYAAVERRFGTADLYMTKDGGDSWMLVEDTGNDPNWFSGMGASGSTGAYTGGWFDNTIIISPYDENVVFVGGIELYRVDINDLQNTRSTSLIGAYNLRDQNISYVHADHHFLVTIPMNESNQSFRILNANDGGVAISYDSGRSWTQITGMGTTQFYGVDKKPGENVYFGGLQDNGSWHSPSDPSSNSNWQRDLGSDGVESVWNYANADLMIGGSQNGNFNRTTDGGQTWYAIPDAKAGRYAPFISKMAHSKADPDLLFTVGSDGIKRSDDFGASWSFTPIEGNWIGWRAFDNVEISIADPQVVWISSRLDLKPYIGERGGVHVSIDGGLSFQEVSQNLPNYLTESSGIGTHPFDSNTAYLLFSAAGTPKIMRTTDLGQSWEDISKFHLSTRQSENSFPDVAVYSLLVMPYDTNIMWAGTEIGLFISEDNGETWQIADNGLPRVGIFQMSIVDGQIVIATYGRGIWTVDLPELENYRPPQVALSPRFNSLAMLPTGQAAIDIGLRSAYDSTFINLGSAGDIRINSNLAAQDTMILLSATEPRYLNVTITSYKNGRSYKSANRDLYIFPAEAQNSFVSNLDEEDAENNFIGKGFNIENINGFNSAAIHSEHPYPPRVEFTYMLKTPIEVSSENSVMVYDDVCLIEEGVSDNCLDIYFFDYVIVEGSLDGINWLPLLDGYDSRADAEWHQAYMNGLQGSQDSNTPGNSSMFKTHTINLLDRFSSGDKIFIRFRLSSDQAAEAWGWAIDNIRIQSGGTHTFNPDQYALAQNYPNPFNNTTNIEYNLPESGKVNLTIYNMLGQKVRTLVSGLESEGVKFVAWNGRDDLGNPVSSGLYIYRLNTSEKIISKKMVLRK